MQAYLAQRGTTALPEAGFEPVSEEQIEIELLRRKAQGPLAAQGRTAPEARDEKA